MIFENSFYPTTAFARSEPIEAICNHNIERLIAAGAV